MNKEHSTNVGVIGLGSMGLGMAKTLVRQGFNVKGFDLSAERRILAQDFGAIPCEAPSQAFDQSDFLVFSLPNAQIVERVVDENMSHLGGRAHGKTVVIDTSTSEPDVSRKLAVKLAHMGHGFIDAPVSGGPTGAESGKLTMMIGGDDADITLASSVIEALSAKVLHVGASGAGNVAKLVNNFLAAAHLVTTGEALKLAVAGGIDAQAALDVINSASGGSTISQVHFPTWIMNDHFNSGFTMALMRKDIRLFRALASAKGVSLPMAQLVATLWEQSDARDSDDFTLMGAFK